MLNDALTRLMNSWPWAKSVAQEDDGAFESAPLSLEETTFSDQDVAPMPTFAASAEGSGLSECELIAAAQTGDEDAFAALVERHHAQVFGLACRTMRDPDEAQEIAQDVFLAAWRGLPNFRGEARLSTWLYRITYRRCLQSIEARRDRLAALGQLATLHLERLANVWSEMQSSFAEQEWRLAIREQIELLPVKYQMVLLMRHWQELSYEEIAQQMMLPINTVKTHLFRARAMLRDQLQNVALPKMELPKVELPHVEFPDVGAALREGIDHVIDSANSLGGLLHGHVNLGT